MAARRSDWNWNTRAVQRRLQNWPPIGAGNIIRSLPLEERADIEASRENDSLPTSERDESANGGRFVKERIAHNDEINRL